MNGTRVFESLNAEWSVVCAEPGHTQMVLGWLREGGVHFGDGEVEGGARAYERGRGELALETLHLAGRELKAEGAEGGVVKYPYLDEVLSGEPADDDPARSAWARVLERQAARAGLLRDGEGVDGARGELVELLVWAVGAGRMDADRARVIADETRVGAQAGAGVSAVAWRKRRSRTVRQMRVVAERWVQAA